MPICNNRSHHHHHDHHAPRQEIPVEDLRRFENVLSADLSEQVTSRWWTFTPQRLRVTLPQIKVDPENNTVLAERNLSTVDMLIWRMASNEKWALECLRQLVNVCQNGFSQ